MLTTAADTNYPNKEHTIPDDANTHSASKLSFTDTQSGKTLYSDRGRLPAGNTEVEGYQSNIFIK